MGTHASGAYEDRSPGQRGRWRSGVQWRCARTRPACGRTELSWQCWCDQPLGPPVPDLEL